MQRLPCYDVEGNGIQYAYDVFSGQKSVSKAFRQALKPVELRTSLSNIDIYFELQQELELVFSYIWLNC